MIDYNHGRYGFGLIFQWTGSVLPKVFVVSVPCSLVCLALQLFARDLLDKYAPEDDALKLFGGFTFVLGFLLVFRSNQAHTRWWEGCTLLMEIRGEWFNAYTSSLAFCVNTPEKAAATRQFQHQFARLLSLLYNCALQQITSTQGSDFELISLDGFDTAHIWHLQNANDRVEIVFQWVQKLLAEASGSGIIQMQAPLLSRVFSQLGSGMVKVSNARKISEFPMPFPLAQLVSVMMILLSCFTVLMCAIFVKNTFWAPVLSFVIISSFFGVNLIAVEIEEPFGNDDNDLPMQGFARDMNDSLVELLAQSAQSVPAFVYSPEIHDFCGTLTSAEFEEALTHTERLGDWRTLKNTSSSLSLAAPPGTRPSICTQGSAMSNSALATAKHCQSDRSAKSNSALTTAKHCQSGGSVLSARQGNRLSAFTEIFGEESGVLPVAATASKSKRRTFIAQDHVAKRDGPRRKSQRNADVFNFSGQPRRLPSLRSARHTSFKLPDFDPNAPDVNVDDGDKPPGFRSGPAVSSAASFPAPVEPSSNAECGLDLGKLPDVNATEYLRNTSCLDADPERFAARMESHVMQIATNVHVIKEAIAIAADVHELHRGSPNLSPNHLQAAERFDGCRLLVDL